MSKSKYNRFEKDLLHGIRVKKMYNIHKYIVYVQAVPVQCRGFLDKTQFRITIIQLNSMTLNMF